MTYDPQRPRQHRDQAVRAQRMTARDWIAFIIACAFYVWWGMGFYPFWSVR